jgi:hypothetical protein
MNSESAIASPRKRPWHLWLVGILALLWYCAGAYTIFMAQLGRLPTLSVDEAAYYAAQPAWFVIATDISLISAMAGSVALLLKSRVAIWLFELSLTSILLTNLYDLAAGTSRVFANTGAMVVTIIIVVIAILLPIYAWALNKRGV